MIMVIKDICNNNWAQEKRSRAWSSNIMIPISVVSSTGIYFFYGYFWIPNFFFPDTASVYTYSVNPAYQSTTFWIRIPELKFLNILWIRNHVDAKSRCFLSGDVTRSSPALYLEYCIQDGNLEWSRELSAWSGNVSIIDTSTTSRSYFFRKCTCRQQRRIWIFTLWFKGLRPLVFISTVPPGVGSNVGQMLAAMLGYVHTAPEEFSTGWKFMLLGVQLTRNHLNRTKI